MSDPRWTELRATLDHAEEHEAPAPGVAWGPHQMRFKDIRDLLATADRVAELEAALEPFARALSHDPDADEHAADATELWDNHIAMALTFGDLRRARTALSGEPK